MSTSRESIDGIYLISTRLEIHNKKTIFVSLNRRKRTDALAATFLGDGRDGGEGEQSYDTGYSDKTDLVGQGCREGKEQCITLKRKDSMSGSVIISNQDFTLFSLPLPCC